MNINCKRDFPANKMAVRSFYFVKSIDCNKLSIVWGILIFDNLYNKSNKNFIRRVRNIMEGEKTKEQLLKELIEMQKQIEQKVEDQYRFINRFQLLIRNEGLFSQVIDNFPYPIAIFDKSGVLTIANKILISKAKLSTGDVTARRINLLNRITNENYSVFQAVEDIFLGETTVLKNLVDPISLFSKDDSCSISSSFQSTVFFPVVGSSRKITHGVIMFMN